MFGKKEWLDKLYYDIGKQKYDFELCNLYKDGERVISSKWKKYSDVCFGLNPNQDYLIRWVNNRTILPNEIVLDIEEKTKIKEIIIELKKYTSNFKVYETGSKGYHIHLFFQSEINVRDKEMFIQKFGADRLKCGERVMIALEYCPHWKSGKIKQEVNIDGI